MAFELPNLKYGIDALQKSIDPETMTIHHDKHHAAYVANLNTAIEKYPDLANKSLEDLIKNIKSLPQDIQNAVRNNAGGHWNHSFFWEILTPESVEIPAKLNGMIVETFGSIEDFKTAFKAAGLARFGSGWVWLIVNEVGKLQIISTPNQDNPLMDIAEIQGKPILALDVWEHAYYLRYQNRRADYIDAFWAIVDWDKVQAILD